MGQSASHPAIDDLPMVINDLAERAAPIVRDGDVILLAASKCRACDAHYIPDRPVCLSCGGRTFEPVTVPGRGTLYSFSTIHVSASRPVAYTLGYVDIMPTLRILVHLSGDPAGLGCDQPVVCVGAEGGAALFAAEGASA